MRWVRLDMKWKEVEPTRGEYVWAAWDPLISGYSQAGIAILLSVAGSPDWARPAGDNRRQDRPPKGPAGGKVKKVPISRIFRNEDFGYRTITVERPLRLNFQASPERIAHLAEQSAFAAGGAEIVSMRRVTEGASSEFVGYERLVAEATVRSFRAIERAERGDLAWSSAEGAALEIVVDRTPFYATSGGQAADEGRIEMGGRRLEVRDVAKRGGEIVHVVEAPWREEEAASILAADPRVRLEVHTEERLAVARNHTATHLLHAALRGIVGAHVAQAGSLVERGRLRFDFNHYEPVAPAALREIERRVNGWIRDAVAVETDWMGYQEAIERGIIALFDEKYGERVRAVRVEGVSAELCGGTHVGNTGQIGLFLITAESGVAVGVRRIEALTGGAALGRVHALMEDESELARLLRASRGETVERAREVVGEIDELRRELKRMEKGGAGEALDRIIAGGATIDGILVASGLLAVKDLGALRNQADAFRSKVRSGVAVLAAELNEKMQYIVAVSDDLVERGVAADALVRELGAVAGGGGGGKKHLAQLGTKDLESAERVCGAIAGIVHRIVST